MSTKLDPDNKGYYQIYQCSHCKQQSYAEFDIQHHVQANHSCKHNWTYSTFCPVEPASQIISRECSICNSTEEVSLRDLFMTDPQDLLEKMFKYLRKI